MKIINDIWYNYIFNNLDINSILKVRDINYNFKDLVNEYIYNDIDNFINSIILLKHRLERSTFKANYYFNESNYYNSEYIRISNNYDQMDKERRKTNAKYRSKIRKLEYNLKK